MKQIIFFVMLLALPIGMAAQVDDLYYVPTKKKANKEVKSNTVSIGTKTVGSTGTSGGTQVTRINAKSNDRIVNGRSEDEYNRRTLPAQEYEYEEEDTIYTDEATDGTDYTYSTRLVRFHSPRRSSVVSSPLYWNVVYESGVDNWTIYDDGVYWDIYPGYTTYSTYYSHPWHYHSWQFGWHTGYGFGWHHSPFYWSYTPWHWSCNPWYWGYPYEWYSFSWGFHNHNHGLGAYGHGWHRSAHGGYRNASHTGRNGGGNFVPRASGPSRADRGVRATTPRTSRTSTAQTSRTDKGNAAQQGRTDRVKNSTERVYDRPSSTRNNASRSGVTRQRTRDGQQTGQPNGQQSKVNWIDGITRDRTRNNNNVKDNSQNRSRNQGTGSRSSGSSNRSHGTYNGNNGSSSSGRSYNSTYSGSGSSGSRSSGSSNSYSGSRSSTGGGGSSFSSGGGSSRSSNYSGGGGSSRSRGGGGGGGGSRGGGRR